MSLLGLIRKFHVDRYLTDGDRKNRLLQKNKLNVELLAQVSAIRISFSYIEVVDKYFSEKGFVTAWSVVVVTISLCTVIGFTVLGQQLWNTVYADRHGALISVLLVVYTTFSALASLPVWGIRQEAFRYTHYPIRLNRRNRMVYVHRIDGTILRVPWDEVFFTLVKEPVFPSGAGVNWAIHGHVLDADGETVRETFAFSEVEAPQVVIAHWEFLRRYMEDGPEAVIKHINYYIPVSRLGHRESLREGIRHLRMRYGQFAGIALIYFPFDFASALARWVAMRTGKLPVWPDEVEAECTVADDDPWVRDWRNNPAKYR